jgi:hypothetical protein
MSTATSLGPGGTNGADPGTGLDVFVHVLRTGTVRRVSVGPHGRQWNHSCGMGGFGLSADGRIVVLACRNPLIETARFTEVYLHDRRTGRTRRAAGPMPASNPRAPRGFANVAVFPDGRHLGVDSTADEVRPPKTPVWQVYVQDQAGDHSVPAGLEDGPTATLQRGTPSQTALPRRTS